MEAVDADVLLDHVTVRDSDSRGSRYLILTTRTRMTMESNHYEGNDVVAGGLWRASGQQFGGAMVKVSDAWLTSETAPSQITWAVESGS